MNHIKCANCSRDYAETRKPCPGTCGHSICMRCARKSSICPICSKFDAFLNPNPNYQAWELAKELRGKIDELDCWDDEEELKRGPCFECSTFSEILRLCTECAEKDGLIRRFRSHWILTAKSVNNRKEFLKLKSLAICEEHCAFEGNIHRGHRKTEKLENVLKGNMRLKSGLLRNSVEERFARISIQLEQRKCWKKTRFPRRKMKLSRSCDKRAFIKLCSESERIMKEYRRLKKENAKIQMRQFEMWNSIQKNKDLKLEVSLLPKDIQDIDKKIDKQLKEISLDQLVADSKENIEKLKKKGEELIECEEILAKKKKVFEDIQRYSEPKLTEKAAFSMLRSSNSLANVLKSGEETLQKALIHISMMKKLIEASIQPWKHSEYAHLLKGLSSLTPLLQTFTPGLRFTVNTLRGVSEDGPPGKCVPHRQTKKERRKNIRSFTFTRNFIIPFDVFQLPITDFLPSDYLPPDQFPNFIN